MTRDAGESESRSAIVLTLFITSVFGLILALYYTYTGLFNAVGWAEAVVFLLFAVGYGLHQFR